MILEIGGVAGHGPEDVSNAVEEANKLQRKAVLMRIKSGSETPLRGGPAEDRADALSEAWCKARRPVPAGQAASLRVFLPGSSRLRIGWP